MGTDIAVSFENEVVKIVYASLIKGELVVHDAFVLKDKELDSFLEKERTKEFIVVKDFKDIYQDRLFIPPAKKKYIKGLIEAGIRKKSPFEEFSYLYRLIGERFVDRKKMKEFSVFVVKVDEIKDIVNRFIDKGKIVKAFYPHVFSITNQVNHEAGSVLCVSGADINRTLFVLTDGKVEFVRVIPSSGRSISDSDIQSINSTINYCKQTLKISLTSTIFIGEVCKDYNTTMDIETPVNCLVKPDNVKVPVELYLDFIYPVSAFFTKKELDIAPSDYKDFYSKRKLFRYSAAVFILLSVAGVVYSGYILKNTIQGKNKINVIRRSLTNINDITALYVRKESELERYAPFITFNKKTEGVPEIQGFLSAFSEIYTRNIKIESITMEIEGSALKTKVGGRVKGGSSGDIHGAIGYQKFIDYQRFIDSIKMIKSMTIKNQALSPEGRVFQVDIEYRSAASGAAP